MIDIQIDEENLYAFFLHNNSNFILFYENEKYKITNNREFYQKDIKYDQFVNKKLICSASLNNSYSFVATSSESYNQSEFYDCMKFLVQKIPLFSNYDLIVEKNNFGTIENYLDKKIFTLDDLQFLYHGTSKYYLNAIFNEGIKPRSETNVISSFANTSQDSMPECIYLCSHPSYSMKDAASRAAKKTGSQPEILRIDMAGIDKNKLLPCQKIYQENMSIDDSLLVSKNLRYYGKIDPKYISLENLSNHYIYPKIFFEYEPIHRKILNDIHASKENNDPNRARTDPSMQGK